MLLTNDGQRNLYNIILLHAWMEGHTLLFIDTLDLLQKSAKSITLRAQGTLWISINYGKQ